MQEKHSEKKKSPKNGESVRMEKFSGRERKGCVIFKFDFKKRKGHGGGGVYSVSVGR